MTVKALHTCSVSVRHAAMETQGSRHAVHARSRSGAGSYSITSSGRRRCVRERELGPKAPQLSTRGPPFTRALPPPPRGPGRGPGGCPGCLASCSPNRKPKLRPRVMLAQP
ncbi:hypothetical protein Cadr_000027976 [Camelus dromedarius]|uniref:Uncharacterized protein n=1 Tax=Camelus dromedarius TaxID=9838 RepID=A0A5N4C9F3_CAMDR|nr:hypothetical protein Cadr_000027976 [Camelus dromedarius]